MQAALLFRYLKKPPGCFRQRCITAGKQTALLDITIAPLSTLWNFSSDALT